MAYRNFITIQTRRKLRKEVMYQVIIEDICEVFGYDKSTDEFKKFQELINGRFGGVNTLSQSVASVVPEVDEEDLPVGPEGE